MRPVCAVIPGFYANGCQGCGNVADHSCKQAGEAVPCARLRCAWNEMKYILMPVKDLANAKQRLAGLMSQGERADLAWLMLRHVFGEVAAAAGYDRAAVVTLYEPAIQLAAGLGFQIIKEEEQISESASVDFGSAVLHNSGAHAVLRLPIDLPLVRAHEVETILSHLPNNAAFPSAVMVPSRDGTGTNALGRTPPELFPSHFGPGSLGLHRAEALRCGALLQEFRMPGVECDIDDSADILYFLEQGHPCATREFLMDLGIHHRLNCGV
jgi:2-phospho-L-lactate guanylyltransferase